MTAVSNTRLTVSVVPPSDPRAQQALRAYYHDIAGRYYGRPLTEAEADQILAEEPDEDLQPPTGWFWLATLDGAPAGCIGLRYVLEEGTRVGELTRVYVSAAVRRQGLGARLMTAVEDRAAADGVTSLRLDVRTDLVEAQALYLRQGYREVPAFNDSPYAGRWFRKSLT